MNCIVFIPADYTNSRQVADAIKGQSFESTTKLREHIEEQLEKEEGETVDGEILIYNLIDFVDEVNDGILDVITNDFISYVNLPDSVY